MGIKTVMTLQPVSPGLYMHYRVGQKRLNWEDSLAPIACIDYLYFWPKGVKNYSPFRCFYASEWAIVFHDQPLGPKE